MTSIRIDHIAGGLFAAGGLLVFAVSGDLPFGSLSLPGAGFMPKLIATLLIGLGALLAFGGAASERFAEVDWSDLSHAAGVLVITATAIALYTHLGFLIVLPLMMFALLVGVEHKHPLPAGLYSIALALLAYWVFKTLRAPMPSGPFGF